MSNIKEERLKRLLVTLFALIFGLTFLGSSPVFAKDVNSEINDLYKRIEELEKKIETQKKETREVKEIGKEFKILKEAYEHISIGGGITGIVQGTSNNDDNIKSYDDNETYGKDSTDGSYSADLEIEVDLEKWGIAFMHLEGGNGSGVTDNLINALTGVNADALDPGDEDEDELDIEEYFWQFSFMDEMFTVTAGKVDPTALFDENAVANDETTQFLADIFVNNVCMEWPDYTPGLHLMISPHELLDIRLGVLSSDNDWDDLFDEVFTVAEIDLKPNFGGMEGNYRLYYWRNALDHVEWDDIEKGKTKDDEKNWGLGLSFDQQVTPDITLFCRFGMQDDDIAGESFSVSEDEDEVEELEPFAMEYSWSVGGQITGSLWGRPDDVVGIAFGQAILSDDYEDYLEDEGIDTEDESHFEIYYSLCLNEYVAITADYQLIDSIGGDDDQDAVSVFGLRTQISF
jgi:carbohydrate-selective porin OprB